MCASRSCCILSWKCFGEKKTSSSCWLFQFFFFFSHPEGPTCLASSIFIGHCWINCLFVHARYSNSTWTNCRKCVARVIHRRVNCVKILNQISHDRLIWITTFILTALEVACQIFGHFLTFAVFHSLKKQLWKVSYQTLNRIGISQFSSRALSNLWYSKRSADRFVSLKKSLSCLFLEFGEFAKKILHN